MVIELCRVKFWRKVFSVVKYCTSNALYSPRGVISVTSASVLWTAGSFTHWLSESVRYLMAYSDIRDPSGADHWTITEFERHCSILGGSWCGNFIFRHCLDGNVVCSTCGQKIKIQSEKTKLLEMPPQNDVTILKKHFKKLWKK
ncbi:unnamed protein product [Callosobruchus maculatus]|uniref:Uncharacterized protein n=1 Tax=Callosobruchus maculatus TaxID=64391 RepID=A0A653CF67_CALMS|nr:unnamed protein product [Callosobruchus maculatus]